MMKTRITYVLVLAILMFACKYKQTTNTAKTIEFTNLSQGNLHGNGQEGIVKSKLIISDQKSFEVLLSKINAVNDEITPAPTVNFDQSIVLAVFDEIKSHGGHSIDITQVSEQEDRIE